jgi:hypothetical protein
MLDISHPSSCYCDILSALRFVHNHNISHNNDDVRLPNIVVELKNGKATLIDWMGKCKDGCNNGGKNARHHESDSIIYHQQIFSRV